MDKRLEDMFGNALEEGDIIIRSSSHGYLTAYKILGIIETNGSNPRFGKKMRLVDYHKWEKSEKKKSLKGRMFVHYRSSVLLYISNKSQKLEYILND